MSRELLFRLAQDRCCPLMVSRRTLVTWLHTQPQPARRHCEGRVQPEIVFALLRLHKRLSAAPTPEANHCKRKSEELESDTAGRKRRKQSREAIAAVNTFQHAVRLSWDNTGVALSTVPQELDSPSSQQHSGPSSEPPQRPVISVPLDSTLWVTSDESHSRGWDQRLAVQLLRACASQTQWTDYKRHVLPDIESNRSLLLASDSELAAIHDHRLRQQAVVDRAVAVSAANRISQSCDCSIQEALWALATARTRAVELSVPSEMLELLLHKRGEEHKTEPISALIILAPVCDLANHSFDPTADWNLPANERSVHLSLLRPHLSSHELPITISYDQSLDSGELMRRYG